MRGLHAGAIVLVGILLLNGGNYLFHLITARALGPAPYGDVVSLLALAGLVSLPLGGVQIVVARAAARFATSGDAPRLRSVFRLALAGVGAVAVAVSLLLVVAAPLIRSSLGIESLPAIVLTAAVVLPSLLSPVALGVVQGLQRFTLYSMSLGVVTVVRIGLLVVLAAAGLTVSGAMAATAAGVMAGLLLPLVGLRRELRGASAPRPPLSLASLRRSFSPGILGLLAITSLTTADVIVAKAALSDHDAGIYGGASLVGRVIVFLAAAVVTVLLPKVSARTSRGEATADILAASLAVTAAASLALTLVYAALPDLIVKLAFGSEFGDAAGLLGLFGVAMSGYALLNVLLVYHLARGASATSWLLLGGAVVQLGAYGLLHDSPRQILAASIATMAALLVAHELFIEPSLSHAVGRIPQLRGRRR
jgi:O-antigen/teichoic acid export membrane protein